MKNNKKIITLIVVIFLIVLFSFTLNIIFKSKYSRNNLLDLVTKSSIPNNIYIENMIYNNNINRGIAKFYIKDNKEYLYQENENQEKIELFVNNEDNTSVIVLHSEKIITQNNNIDNDFDSALQPLKDNLLDGLNNSMQYKYKYCGKEIVNEINCIKISLTNNENNENYNYYIDENTGYILQYENETSKTKEIYKYNINSVTDEQLKLFNIDNYSDYTFIKGN